MEPLGWFISYMWWYMSWENLTTTRTPVCLFAAAQYWPACAVITHRLSISVVDFDIFAVPFVLVQQLREVDFIYFFIYFQGGGSAESRERGSAASCGSKIKITVISLEAGWSRRCESETVVWLVMTQPKSHYSFDGRFSQKSIFSDSEVKPSARETSGKTNLLWEDRTCFLPGIFLWGRFSISPTFRFKWLYLAKLVT